MTITRPQSASTASPDRGGLRVVTAAAGVSSIGDGVLLSAAPLAAAAVTRDPTAVAIVLAAEHLPWAVVTPFAGVYVDRWPKRATMITADVLRGAAVAVLAAMIALGVASIAALAVCAAAMVTGMVFHSAASEAMIADLAQRDERVLHRVNGRIQSATTAGMRLVGPPAGSWSFAVAPWLPFAANAASFAVSAALLTAVPGRPAVVAPRRRLWQAIREGVGFLFAHGSLRTLALLIGIGNFSVNMAMAVLVLYATDPGGLGISDAAYGLLLTAMAVGGIVGGLIASRVIDLLGNRLTVIVGLLVQAGTWIAVAGTDSPYVAGLAVSLLWISIPPVTVVIIAARQRQTPPELLGRVISAFRIVGNGLSPLGAMVGGLIAAVWNLRGPMLVAAGVLVVAGVLASLGTVDESRHERGK